MSPLVGRQLRMASGAACPATSCNRLPCPPIDLLSFEFYGCGVIPSIGLTVPPNFCGGALKMRVVFTPAGTSLTIPGIITVFCVIGPQAPPPHDNPTQPGEEGVTAVVPRIANFNKIVSGMNVYIQTS